MRNAILFLLALGVGALTVSGQDNERTELLDKIKELEKILAKHADRKNVPQDKFVIRRIYDVSELTGRIADRSLTPTNLQVSKYVPPEQPEKEEPVAYFEIDSLLELLRQTVEPDTWDSVEGANIEVKNAALFVWNLPRVHKGIANLIEHLRRQVRRRVVIDVIAVPVNKETATLLAQRPRELSPAEATGIRSMTPLGTARLTCFDGHQSAQKNGTRQMYLQDYDVEIASNTTIGDPIRCELFSGCIAQIRACMDPSANGVVLHCQLERTQVAAPMRTMDTEHGPVDLPVMELTRVNTSLWVPLDKMVVIGGTTGGTNPCVFVVTAKLVE